MKLGMLLAGLTLLQAAFLANGCGRGGDRRPTPAPTIPPDPCSSLTFVSRSSWNARTPNSISNISTPVQYVFIHHTVTPGCSSQADCSQRMRSMQNFHMNTRNYVDIGYNFLVGGDGKVYVGRGWNREGGHTVHYNRNGIAISFIGNFQTGPAPPNMKTTAQTLIKCGVSKGFIRSDYSLHGHREVACKDCPGTYLYSSIRNWTNFRRQQSGMKCYCPGNGHKCAPP